MIRVLFLSVAILGAHPAAGGEIDDIVDRHILPGFEDLAASTAHLASAAALDCAPESAELRSAFHSAFDDWISVSHLRFGPTEVDERAFAIYFWPDTRGATQRTLSDLIAKRDPVVENAAEFQEVSIAGRGFFALERLLFDESFLDPGTADYRCALTQAISVGLAENSAEIRDDWTESYADLMRNAGSNDTYRSAEEALRQLFTSLSTGLQFTSDARLGRPLGTFDRPRPNRAEARRSDRSLAHVVLSLEATRALAALISDRDASLDAKFERALERAKALDDSDFSDVADIQGRIRVEALQQLVDDIREELANEVGPKLGIASGFNALDGD